MILYDTPGVILKKLRKLDDMMMQNVRTATLNADCVLVVVDACHSPEQVNLSYFSMLLLNLACCLAQLKGEQQQSMCVLNKDFKELFEFLYLAWKKNGMQVMDMLEDGATTVTDRRPTLLVLNKKDLIKPGEIAKKKEVSIASMALAPIIVLQHCPDFSQLDASGEGTMLLLLSTSVDSKTTIKSSSLDGFAS